MSRLEPGRHNPSPVRAARRVARTHKEICCWLGVDQHRCLGRMLNWATGGNLFATTTQLICLAGAGFWIWYRDTLYEFRRGDDFYLTVYYEPVEGDCDAFKDKKDQDKYVSTTDEFATLWIYNELIFYAGDLMLDTFGPGVLSAEEFELNHCDPDTLQRMMNYELKEEERRDPACEWTDNAGKECEGGMYRYESPDDGETTVESAPPGYYSPEFFTCLVRCPTGGFCPRSRTKDTTMTHNTKCKYPGRVDKHRETVAVYDDETNTTRYVCPGSRHLYLCPEGNECQSSDTRSLCPSGTHCPRGSKKRQACDGASPLASHHTLCSSPGLGYPDYSVPATVFFVVCISTAVVLHLFSTYGYGSSRARRRRRLARASARHERAVLLDASTTLNNNTESATSSRSVVAAMRYLSKAEARWHRRVIEALTGVGRHDTIDPSLRSQYYGVCSSINVSRLVVYCGGGSFILAGVALAGIEPATFPCMLFFGLCLYGMCGVCQLDLVSSLRQTDGGTVFTSLGCTRHANLVVFGIFSFVALVFLSVGFGDNRHLIKFDEGLTWVQFATLMSLVIVFATGVGALCLRHATCCQACSCFDCCCCSALDAVEADVRVFSEEKSPSVDDGIELATSSNSSTNNPEFGGGVSSGDAPTGSRSSATSPLVLNPFRWHRRLRREEPKRVTDDVELRIDLRFEGLGLRLRSSGRVILNGVSGSIDSGCVTAIMGPSGGGKTTLLNCLADRAKGYGKVFGSRFVNGREVDDLAAYSAFVGYVPQDDIMLPSLTVRQTLEFYAAIRASTTLSRTEVETRAIEAMQMVELRPTTWDEVVGDAERRGISGGEKKRTNLAIEIVARPCLLFLDEPTSGLDSTTSAQVVEALRKLANRGCNIVVVLHQPSYSIFSSFMQVILLGVGGHTVFHGKPGQVMDYFSNNHRDGGPVFDKPEFSNPADWMLDVTLGRVAPQQEEPENVAAFFPLNDAEAAAEALSRLWLARSREGREQFQPDVLERPADSRVLESLRSQRAFVVQFICFAKRAFLQHLQLPGRLYFDCALMSFFGALFGMQSKNVKVHKLPIAQLWIGIGLQLFLAVATLPVFGSERVVFWREAARGSGMSLNIAAYFLGKDIVQIPCIALLTLAFAVPFYSIAAPTPRFSFYFLCLFCMSYAISGYAYIASVVGGKSAQLVTVVLCLVLTMLSGFGSQTLDKLNSAPGLRIVPWLSPVRWVGETLVVAQTRKLSFAWKMSPTVYRKPTRDSALALLFGYTFHEGWLQDVDIKTISSSSSSSSSSNLDEVCRLRGNWLDNEAANLPMLILLGGVARLAALSLMRNTYNTCMGEPPLEAKILVFFRGLFDAARLKRCCTPRLCTPPRHKPMHAVHRSMV